MRKFEEKLWNANQSWHLESFWQIHDRVVKVEIRVNAYRFQSWYLGSLFDGDKFNVLTSRIPNVRVVDKIRYIDEQLSEEQLKLLYAEEHAIASTCKRILERHLQVLIIRDEGGKPIR